MVFGVNFHEYQIIGRHQPSAHDQNPKLYRMRIFARTPAQAKSRYWYYMSQYRKVKKATGQILSLSEIFEKKPLKIKNFGIFLRYTNKSGVSNLYKEYRDLSRVGAVQQMYHDMAGQYRTQFRNIQIVSVDEVQPKDVRRNNIKQFHDSRIKFPLPHRVLKTPKKLRTTFVAHRPTVIV